MLLIRQGRSMNQSDEEGVFWDACDAKDKYANRGSLLLSSQNQWNYSLVDSAYMLLSAIKAVSTSPPMNEFAVYRERVNQIKYGNIHQPKNNLLFDEIFSACRSFKKTVPDRISRIAATAALISFTDDYTGLFPKEAFDPKAVKSLIDWIKKKNTPVSISDCISHSSVQKQKTVLEGILVLHSALRQIARGRDNRALNICELTFEERIAAAEKLLPFPYEISQGGDPAGDAYHYAANLAAGILSSVCPFHQKWMIPLFLAGPYLMKTVRQDIFGSVLFFGNHARIDRMGLKHGLKLGKMLS